MKREIKRYFDQAQLSPERKQAILTDILGKKNKRRHGKRPVWKAAAALCVAAAVTLAIVLPLAFGGNGAVKDAVPTLPVTTASTAKIKGYTSAIVLALNPSVEIRLDSQGQVTEVVGLNEDGISLIEGIDFAGFSLENATIMVVNQLILQEYITAAQIQNEINISLTSDDMTLDTLSVMTNIIKTAAAEHNITVDVIANEDANELLIVLEGQGNPEIWPELDPQIDDVEAKPIDSEEKEIGINVEFVIERSTYSAYVDNVLIHPKEGKSIINLLDFAGMSLRKAALLGIVELIEKDYISDKESGRMTRIFFTGPCSDSDINDVAYLAKLLIEEYDLKIAVIPDLDARDIKLIPEDTIANEKQDSKHAIKDVLNHMVNKDEGDLSQRQIQILKIAYNYSEYIRLFEKRYFVVIPDLTGLTEEKAIALISRLGIVPVVVREKIQGYDPSKENGGLASPSPDAEIEQGYMDELTWEYPVVAFNCVFYQDIGAGVAYQTGLPIQINVVVREDDERPEVLDLRDNTGIVLREMDDPFDISAYPDAFSLSEAQGFDTMIKEMDVTYAITDKADYTVSIEYVKGWADTAVITIVHKDGFPLSKFFVQRGRIIEHEFVWRRDAPTREEGVPFE